MNDGVVQHASRFQIFDERRRRFVHACGHVGMVLGNVFVAVPVASGKAVVSAAPYLHEAHPALQHPARNQAIAPEIFRYFVIDSVETASGFRFLRKVHYFRSTYL